MSSCTSKPARKGLLLRLLFRLLFPVVLVTVLVHHPLTLQLSLGLLKLFVQLSLFLKQPGELLGPLEQFLELLRAERLVCFLVLRLLTLTLVG